MENLPPVTLFHDNPNAFAINCYLFGVMDFIFIIYSLSKCDEIMAKVQENDFSLEKKNYRRIAICLWSSITLFWNMTLMYIAKNLGRCVTLDKSIAFNFFLIYFISTAVSLKIRGVEKGYFPSTSFNMWKISRMISALWFLTVFYFFL